MSKEKQLWLAATDGELALAREILLDQSVDVNWVGEEKLDTPLHRACRFGRVEVARELLAHRNIDVNKGNRGRASPFSLACQEGHLAVAELMLVDPRVEVNGADKDGAPPFYFSCQNGHTAVVELLLADPRLDVNRALNDSLTSFAIACELGFVDVVALLLDDPRVDVNRPQKDVIGPLWFAAQNGHLEVARLLLASDRQVDTLKRSTWNRRTAAEQGRAVGLRNKGANDTEEVHHRKKTYGPVIADMIDAFDLDPAGERERLRRVPRTREFFIGRAFALMIFYADGFVTVPPKGPPEVRRLLEICARLPLDLQMVLSNRMFGSGSSIVKSRDSEPGFRWLFRSTTWERR